MLYARIPGPDPRFLPEILRSREKRLHLSSDQHADAYEIENPVACRPALRGNGSHGPKPLYRTRGCNGRCRRHRRQHAPHGTGRRSDGRAHGDALRALRALCAEIPRRSRSADRQDDVERRRGPDRPLGRRPLRCRRAGRPAAAGAAARLLRRGVRPGSARQDVDGRPVARGCGARRCRAGIRPAPPPAGAHHGRCRRECLR